MQVLDDQKKEKILTAAAELFAKEPFHKVLLSDVAEAAQVGKGTLYTYFRNKEDLYRAVLSQGFSRLLKLLHERVATDDNDALGNLEIVVGEYVDFASQNPHLFELMRAGPEHSPDCPQREKNRREFSNLIESLIRRGIAAGQFEDPHPELTAKYIPGLLRSIFLGSTDSVERRMLTEHITRFIRQGLMPRESGSR